MSDIIHRLTTLISSNSGTIGTSAVQLSGGPSTNYPLTGVSSTFYPTHHRQVFRFVNNGSAAIYLGSASTVTTASGWFKQVGPGQMVELDISGSVPVWAISGTASVPFTAEELS